MRANFTEKYLWEKMSKYGKKCQKMSKNHKIWQKKSNYVKKCQNMSKMSKCNSKNFKKFKEKKML